MKTTRIPLPALLGVALPLLLLADLAPESVTGVALGREAAAIVGAPMTPLSYAGVARRTTRRVVAVEATAVTAAAATTAVAASVRATGAPRSCCSTRTPTA